MDFDVPSTLLTNVYRNTIKDIFTLSNSTNLHRKHQSRLPAPPRCPTRSVLVSTNSTHNPVHVTSSPALSSPKSSYRDVAASAPDPNSEFVLVSVPVVPASPLDDGEKVLVVVAVVVEVVGCPAKLGPRAAEKASGIIVG
jgi:hypothetical protein